MYEFLIIAILIAVPALLGFVIGRVAFRPGLWLTMLCLSLAGLIFESSVPYAAWPMTALMCGGVLGGALWGSALRQGQRSG